MPPDRLLHVGFEALLTDTRGQLARIGEFVDGEVDTGWVERAVTEIRPELARSEGTLDAATTEIVERAERPLRDAGL